MSAWPEPASFQEQLPKLIKFCKICRAETPHQIRCGSGVAAVICVACLSRALSHELDRD